MATENSNITYETYYVPEQSKFPIWASIGLGLFIYGLAHNAE